ncbi:MAG: TRAP transporter small permease [Hyphomicrobiaceae bacterium]
MAEGSQRKSPPADQFGRVLFTISRVLAILGGILLFLIAILTTASVIGRATVLGPIPGDFELVAIGTGVAVFAMLPYCQMTRGNVLVDFFMSPAPTSVKAFCDLLGNIAYLLIAMLITWRMFYGAIDMYKYNELSMTINFPRWTTFPISICCLGFLCIVIAYSISRSFIEMKRGEYLDQV